MDIWTQISRPVLGLSSSNIEFVENIATAEGLHVVHASSVISGIVCVADCTRTACENVNNIQMHVTAVAHSSCK